MKNVFVTGGFGFVGTHLVERLLQSGVEQVTVFDNLSSGTAGIQYLNPTDPVADRRLRVVVKSIRDYDAMRIAMEGHDTVFHLAANPDIARAVKEPTIDFEQGTVLTQNVLEAMRGNGVSNLVYFSGSGVYGDRADVAFREDYGPMEPISTYGASKLASEALISAYCHMFGLTARAFRFANIVGPRQTHGVGYDFLRKLKVDPTKLAILGDGTQSKSYIHADDVLNAVFQAIDGWFSGGPYAAYDVFNVASGDSLTVREIAHMAVEVAGAVSAELVFGESPRGWKGDVPVVRFNTEKIQSLGWRCQRNSREAMQAALEAMVEEIK